MSKLLKASCQLLNPKISRLAATSYISNDWSQFSKRNSSNYQNNSKSNNIYKNALYSIMAAGGIALGYAIFANKDDFIVKLKNVEKHEVITKVQKLSAGPNDNQDWFQYHLTERKDLPTYKMDEVMQHDNDAKRIWVTYGIGVYDITDFIPQHPGREKILMGAGSAIDTFWEIYQQHISEEILTMLEKYRIGNIIKEEQTTTEDMGEIWANEPKRHPLLKPVAQRPFNAETPPLILADAFYTPNEFFYVRNHLPVPLIEENNYELEIQIESDRVKSKQRQQVLKLKDIKEMPKHTITAAIMCGGNRRSDMTKVKEVKGIYSYYNFFSFLISCVFLRFKLGSWCCGQCQMDWSSPL